MKIERGILISLTLDGWCPVCADYTEMEKGNTGLPGIQHYKCKCGASFMINLLENNDDELEVDDSFKFPESIV